MPTQHIDLNGTWDFVADLDPKYHAIHGGFHNPAANRRHWQKVPVPGVWQKYAERYDIFEGVCWFAREFTLAEAPTNAQALLRFGAVNYLANVHLNGEKVGTHEGGYTEFVFDVSGKLKAGRNHLAVQVDNRATTIKWPPCLGYFNYGGIHRGVSLEIAEGPALADVRLETEPKEKGWELAVSARIDSVDSLEGLLVRVSSEGLSWETPLAAKGVLFTRVPFFDTPAWTPDAPHLVPIAVELLDAARGGHCRALNHKLAIDADLWPDQPTHKTMSQNQDLFAQFGAQRVVEQQRLVEPQPPQLAKRFLPAGKSNPRATFCPLPKLDTAERLQAELERQRRWAAPFILVDLPAPDHTDAWVLRDRPERRRLRGWVREVLCGQAVN